MSTTGTATTWFKSTFSKEAANCVEVRFAGDSVFIRDSKYLRDPANDAAEQPSIEVGLSMWEAFLAAVLAPDEPAEPAVPAIDRTAFGVTVSSGETVLRYTTAEWAAFTAGIVAGEFAA